MGVPKLSHENGKEPLQSSKRPSELIVLNDPSMMLTRQQSLGTPTILGRLRNRFPGLRFRNYFWGQYIIFGLKCLLAIALFVVLWLVFKKEEFIMESYATRPNPNVDGGNIDETDILEKIPQDQDIEVAPIEIIVYYEALCPDSRYFIYHQLYATYLKMSRYMDVKLVPYGKAYTRVGIDGHPVMECQHGPKECAANTVHSCAIKYIPDPLLLISYITCMIQENLDPNIGEKCARKKPGQSDLAPRVDWEAIKQCSTSEEGLMLLKEHGEATHALQPKVSFIPTITLNGSQDQQPQILKNLKKVMCSILKQKPLEC